MKQFSLLLCAVVFSTGLFAQAGPETATQIRVRSLKGANVRIEIEGRAIPTRADAQITVPLASFGNNGIRLFEANDNNAQSPAYQLVYEGHYFYDKDVNYEFAINADGSVTLTSYRRGGSRKVEFTAASKNPVRQHRPHYRGSDDDRGGRRQGNGQSGGQGSYGGNDQFYQR